MRSIFFGLLAGLLFGALDWGLPVTAQTCGNVLNNCSSKIECCGCSGFDITSTDHFQNNNPEDISLACILVVPIENINENIPVKYITTQCEFLAGYSTSGNKSVGVTREDNCLKAKYATKVQITGQNPCNSHEHEFAEDGLCCE